MCIESYSIHIIIVGLQIRVLRRDEKEGRSKQGQTNNKAKQHSTPKAVTFPKKNELPQVELEPTTLHSRQSALLLSYQGSSAGLYTFVLSKQYAVSTIYLPKLSLVHYHLVP